MGRRQHEMRKLADMIRFTERQIDRLGVEIEDARKRGFSFSMMTGVLIKNIIKLQELKQLFLDTYHFNYKYYNQYYSYEY